MTKYKNLPNMITMLRIFGVGLIFWVTPYYSAFGQIWAVVLYIVLAVTDFLDGYVARRYNVETDLGKILDPLADKILVLVFLPLLEMQMISSFPVFIILARELSVMTLRIISAKDGTVIPASRFGKIKTVLTLPLCGFLMVCVPVPISTELTGSFSYLYQVFLWFQSWPKWISSIWVSVTVIVTILSFLEYFWGYLWKKSLTEEKGNREKAIKRLISFVPNLITLGNGLLGGLGIFLALTGSIKKAFILMILGTVLDRLDGTIARKLGVSSEFGAKLDSSADLVSFGILPAVIVYRVATAVPLDWSIWVATLFALSIFGSVRFRLKRFDQGGYSSFFQGLPSPVGATVIGLASISIEETQILYPMIIIVTCMLMVSTIPYIHPGALRPGKVLQGIIYLTYTMLVITIIQIVFGLDGFVTYYAPEIPLSLIGIYISSPLFIKSNPD